MTKCSNDLFKELTNKQITDAKKKEILVKLNKKSIIKGRLSQEYIDGFILIFQKRQKCITNLKSTFPLLPTASTSLSHKEVL